MKLTVITIGSPQLTFAKQGILEYLKRARRFADIELIHVKEDKKAQEKLMKHLDKKYVVLLDEKGKSYTSQELAHFLHKHKIQSSHLCFVIGGPDGHATSVQQKANAVLSLSSLTLPHDLAMLFTLETLYRSLSILENHPYHRD